jgi:hypothetical protein
MQHHPCPAPAMPDGVSSVFQPHSQRSGFVKNAGSFTTEVGVSVHQLSSDGSALTDAVV